MTTEIEYNEQDYVVYFDVTLGSHGDYFNPPEPPDIHIHSIIDVDGNEVQDYSIINYADEEIYYKLSDGYFD